MVQQFATPGVYIQEFTPAAPIQGVGTNTAAFIGPAAKGELDTPTKITSWDQFRTTFGEQPLPGFFLWYAVRGFFENGGQVCYVVRASNGTYAQTTLADQAGNDIIRVRAHQPGLPVPPIQVEVDAAHLLPAATTTLYQPEATRTAIAGREITVNAGEGGRFRPGDWVTLDDLGERIPVLRLIPNAAGDIIRLASNPVNAHPQNGTVRLADAPAGTRTLRIQPAAPVPAGALAPGTMLTVTQGVLTDTQVVETAQTEPISATLTTYRVTFRQGLDVPFSLDPANPATVESQEFDFKVLQDGASDLFQNLALDPAHPRYFLRTIAEADGLVQVELIEPPPPVEAPENLPDDTGGPVALDSPAGEPEVLADLDASDYLDALETLREIDDVNLIAIPDSTRFADAQATAIVQQALIAHCEQMGDRFAVLDARPGLTLFGADDSIEVQRLGLDSTRGYAALYYPWLRVPPVGPGAPILVPPSGHVCGVIARSDTTRGVHKAPANEIINGALGVERTMSDVDQGELNLNGINVIRVFRTGGRPMLWGARTTATDLSWQYVNVRRLFLFLEESIEEGINWAIFEPNTLSLWQQLKRTISEFLTRVWRDGALFGETAADAFYVRIDETLNPFSEQALGRLHIEIGLRPSYPAEFIIVRIGIWPGGSEVSEG